MTKYLIAFGLALIAGFYAYINVGRQEVININEGKGWDGVHYKRMYDFYKDNTVVPVAPPFGKRVATPYLASVMPTEAASSFLIINITAGIITVAITAIFLGFKLRPAEVVFCTLPLIFYLFSPIRFSAFYPFWVDPLAMMMYAIAAFFVAQNKPWLAVITLSASILVRESGVYFALAIPFVLWRMGTIQRPRALAMAGFSIAVLLASTSLYLSNGGTPQYKVVIWLFWKKMLNPIEITKLMAAILHVLGPYIVLFAMRKDGVLKLEKPENSLSLSMLILAALMAFFGGADTTRLLYVGYPLYVGFLSGLAQEARLGVLILTSASGLAANRFLISIPQPTRIDPLRETEGYFGIFPDYAEPAYALTIIVFWILVWIACRITYSQILNFKLRRI